MIRLELLGTSCKKISGWRPDMCRNIECLYYFCGNKQVVRTDLKVGQEH